MQLHCATLHSSKSRAGMWVQVGCTFVAVGILKVEFVQFLVKNSLHIKTECALTGVATRNTNVRH